MANVSFKRGTTAEIEATPNVDGQLLFDTTDNRILMDDGITRRTYGGDTEIDSTLSTTSTNPVQNKVINGALGEKLGTSDVVDNLDDAIIVTDDGVPVGCKAIAELNDTVDTLNTNLVALEQTVNTYFVGIDLNNQIAQGLTSYTATEDCWINFATNSLNNEAGALFIDDVQVARFYGSSAFNGRGIYPLKKNQSARTEKGTISIYGILR